MAHLRFLVGDDSHSIGKLLVLESSRLGHSSDYLLVQTPQAMLEALAHESWDMVIVNSLVSGFGRVESTELARHSDCRTPVIIIVDGAKKGIGPTIGLESGYWVCRGDPGQLSPILRQCLAEAFRGRAERGGLERGNSPPSTDQQVDGITKIDPEIEYGVPHFVQPQSIQEYPSEAMKLVLRKFLSASEREITVLVMGESGTGKDYMAKHIHERSRRRNGPYFAINCAAVSPELAESELFGHEKGAFTGAHSRKKGLLELAERGTLLLNEIGELSLRLQSKLLAFFDTRHIT